MNPGPTVATQGWIVNLKKLPGNESTQQHGGKQRRGRYIAPTPMDVGKTGLVKTEFTERLDRK